MNEEQFNEERKKQEIAFTKEFINDKVEICTKYIKLRNKCLNTLDIINKTIVKTVEDFPLDSKIKKQYIELIHSGDETKTLEFCQSIANDWGTLNFLVYYATVQMATLQSSKEMLENFDRMITKEEEDLNLLRASLEKTN